MAPLMILRGICFLLAAVTTWFRLSFTPSSPVIHACAAFLPLIVGSLLSSTLGGLVGVVAPNHVSVVIAATPSVGERNSESSLDPHGFTRTSTCVRHDLVKYLHRLSAATCFRSRIERKRY